MGLGAWKSFIKMAVRGRDQQQSTAMSAVMVAFSSGISSPTPGFFLPGERKVEAEDCNFRGLQSLASEPAETLLGLGAAVLGSTTGAGGCPGITRKERGGCDSGLSMSRGWGLELPYGPFSQETLTPLGFPSLGSLGLCSLTGCDDVPRTQQLQVCKDVNEVSHARVAVDPGPQNTGRALLGALTQPQLCLVTHDQGRCGMGNIRLQLQKPGSTTPLRPAVTHQTGTSRRAPGRPSLCRSGT